MFVYSDDFMAVSSPKNSYKTTIMAKSADGVNSDEFCFTMFSLNTAIFWTKEVNVSMRR